MGRKLFLLVLTLILVQITTCASPSNHENHHQKKESDKVEVKRPRVRHRRQHTNESNSKHKTEKTNPLDFLPGMGHWEWVPNTRSGNPYTMPPVSTMPPMYPYFPMPMPMMPAFLPPPIPLPTVENSHLGTIPNNHKKHKIHRISHSNAKNDELENPELTHSTIDGKTTEGNTNKNSNGNRHKGEFDSPKHAINDHKTNESKTHAVSPGERAHSEPASPKRTHSTSKSRGSKNNKSKTKHPNIKTDPKPTEGEINNKNINPQDGGSNDEFLPAHTKIGSTELSKGNQELKSVHPEPGHTAKRVPKQTTPVPLPQKSNFPKSSPSE